MLRAGTGRFLCLQLILECGQRYRGDNQRRRYISTEQRFHHLHPFGGSDGVGQGLVEESYFAESAGVSRRCVCWATISS